MYNGSHGWIYRILRDYLYGPKERMRVSVYKKSGVNYLIRIKSVRSASICRSGVVLVDLPVMYV